MCGRGFGPEGADRAREAREERRGKRPVLDADERTRSIARERLVRRHSIEIMWPALAVRIASSSGRSRDLIPRDARLMGAVNANWSRSSRALTMSRPR